MLSGARVLLRPVVAADLEALTAIVEEPEVARWWPGFDADRVQTELIDHDDDVTVLAIELGGAVVGAIQYGENDDPQYRHASIDLFLATLVHGQGLGSEAIRLLAAHLIDDRGHHRIVIDPAAANVRAIRAYENVGFRRVGVMREYERGPDGNFHDGLLMELLASDLRR